MRAESQVDLLRPTKDEQVQDRLSFLVGSGISWNLPQADHVIRALLGHLAGGGISASDLTKVAGETRFEYLLQLVRDYCDRTLAFMSDLYQRPATPLPYHEILAKLIADGTGCVLTTNFDNLIEIASKEAKASPPLKAVFRDADLRSVADASPVSGLVKLHGSIEDRSTLGVTFESIRRTDAKSEILEKAVRQAPLVVVGYSGRDDTDVIPVLTSARSAWSVYWFIYKRGFRSAYETYEIGSEGTTLPRKYWTLPAYRVMEGMKKGDSMEGRRVIAIVGDTELALEEFLRLRGIEVELRQPRLSPANDDTQAILQRWWHKVGPDRELRGALSLMQLFYTLGEPKHTEAVAAQLREAVASDKQAETLALPKLAMAEYDAGNYDDAKALALKGTRRARHATSQSREEDSWMLAEALLDSYAWAAEASRMNDKEGRAIDLADKGLSLERELLRDIPDPSRRKRLRRLLGDMLSTRGESEITLGRLADAEGSYALAADEYMKGSELNWYWYAKLGSADILRFAGQLTASEELLDQIREGSRSAGWDVWLPLQLAYSSLDIQRVRRRSLTEEDLQKLEELIGNENDSELSQSAKVLKWQFACLHATEGDLSDLEAQRQSLLEDEADDSYRSVVVHMTHADLCRRLGRYEEANVELEALVGTARDHGWQLLALHARTMREDVARLRDGRSTKWKTILRAYWRLRCPIGVAYAVEIGRLSGAQLPLLVATAVDGYLRANRLPWMADPSTEAARERQSALPMVFPGA